MSVSMCVCRVFRSWTAITSRVCFHFTPSVSGIGIRMNRKECMNENCLCYNQHSLKQRDSCMQRIPALSFISLISRHAISLSPLTNTVTQSDHCTAEKAAKLISPYNYLALPLFLSLILLLSVLAHIEFFNFSLYYFHFIVLLQVRTSSLSSNIFTWAHFGETYDCANCNIERATTCAHIHIASHFTLALSLALTHMLNNLSVVSFCVSSIFLYHFIELGCLGLIITLILQKAKLFSNSKSLIIIPLWWKLR